MILIRRSNDDRIGGDFRVSRLKRDGIFTLTKLYLLPNWTLLFGIFTNFEISHN